MELSQTALSVLILCGVPLGIIINVAYRLTDLGPQKNRIILHILTNVKDFAFLILAAVVTVLLVYYVNDGVYRFQSIAGILTGYMISDLLLGKLIVKIRNTVIEAVLQILGVPFVWIWSKTFGLLLAKTDHAFLIRKTDVSINTMMQLASNGFENYTEAKAWKNIKNKRMLQ